MGLSKFKTDIFLEGRFRPNDKDRPDPPQSRGWIVGDVFFQSELNIVPTGKNETEIFSVPLMITIYPS